MLLNYLVSFRKYVCLAKFDEGIYYGALSFSKQAAKNSCATVIIENLLMAGKLIAGKKIKRSLKEDITDVEVSVIFK